MDTRSKITKALLDDGAAIARVVINAALEGDLQACNIVLGRIAPAIKPQTERIAFDFDATCRLGGTTLGFSVSERWAAMRCT
ncbi:MAG: hypothetical protein B7Z20_08710 [Sphingobium sp. 32-64-5]|nr:MAG: hypothetical protein B7Z20_08710 [Sphingobium sp. 32-64-5]